MSEKLKELMAAIGLTDENATQLATVISEELVRQKLETTETLTAELSAAHATALQESTDLSEARLTECVDAAVAQILEENAAKFEAGERVEQISKAFAALNEALAGVGLALNEDASVKAAELKLEESRGEVASLLEQQIATKRELTEVLAELDLAKRSIMFEAATRDLAATSVERVGNLIEKVKFDTLVEFQEGLRLLVEQEKDKDAAEKDKEKGDKEAGKDGDEGEDGKDKPAFIKESFDGKKLHQMTAEERVAFYKGK